MANGRATSNQPLPLWAHRHSGSSFFSDKSNGESELSEIRPADITASHLRPGIPKSRTFSVLYSLTQSFSRGSLTSRGTSSRHVSEDSQASSNVAGDKAITHQRPSYLAQNSEIQTKSASPTSAPLPSSTVRVSDNPKAITTAMPPQYWAGRFMALHDHFHNELLEPHHLARICKVQAAQSPLSECTNQASAAAQNNPSTSAYAITRVAQPSKRGSQQNGTSQEPSCIPQSATSGAILQSTPYSVYANRTTTSSMRNPSSHRTTATAIATTTIRFNRLTNSRPFLPNSDACSCPCPRPC